MSWINYLRWSSIYINFSKSYKNRVRPLISSIRLSCNPKYKYSKLVTFIKAFYNPFISSILFLVAYILIVIIFGVFLKALLNPFKLVISFELYIKKIIR